MKPTKIILHHSLTADSGTVSWGAIRRYHTSHAYRGKIIKRSDAESLIEQKKRVKMPWSDIGYHFGVELVGGFTEVLLGRMPDVSGAHCKGRNGGSLGVCFVGNFDKEPVPKAAWDKGIVLVRYLMAQYDMKIDDVDPHSRFAPWKSCPGKLFNVEEFKRELCE